ncbi:hypothetical protein AMECASPLE_033365 [Ameca splendens]|uniref:Uncharacterized protein n=1 Tax=Ameca splendens TaxID=208324 RepID=A0ABV0Z5K9_9TELE
MRKKEPVVYVAKIHGDPGFMTPCSYKSYQSKLSLIKQSQWITEKQHRVQTKPLKCVYCGKCDTETGNKVKGQHQQNRYNVQNKYLEPRYRHTKHMLCKN